MRCFWLVRNGGVGVECAVRALRGELLEFAGSTGSRCPLPRTAEEVSRRQRKRRELDCGARVVAIGVVVERTRSRIADDTSPLTQPPLKRTF